MPRSTPRACAGCGRCVRRGDASCGKRRPRRTTRPTPGATSPLVSPAPRPCSAYALVRPRSALPISADPQGTRAIADAHWRRSTSQVAPPSAILPDLRTILTALRVATIQSTASVRMCSTAKRPSRQSTPLMCRSIEMPKTPASRSYAAERRDVLHVSINDTDGLHQLAHGGLCGQANRHSFTIHLCLRPEHPHLAARMLDEPHVIRGQPPSLGPDPTDVTP